MNQEHFEKLQAGVAAFNSWRKSNPDVQIDLSGANLQNMDLRKVNLSGADLSGADLSGASLGRADITRANLNRANLHKATLGIIFVNKANLSEANLNESEASFVQGDDVILDGVDLRNVRWYLDNESKIIRKTIRRIVFLGRMQGEASGKGPYEGILRGDLSIDDKKFPARLEISYVIDAPNISGEFTITDETDANNFIYARFKQESAYILTYTSYCDKGSFMGLARGKISFNTKPWNGGKQELEVEFKLNSSR